MLLIALGVSALANLPANASEGLSYTFARCAGQLTALSEHQFLFAHPDMHKTRHQRDEMHDLLGAAATPDQLNTLIITRDGARDALRDLLNRGSFNGDYEDAMWARGHADAQVAICQGLLLAPTDKARK